MKKILSMVLILALAFTFVGCGDNSENNTANNDANNGLVVNENNNANDSANNGSDEPAVEEFDVTEAANNVFEFLPENKRLIKPGEFVEKVKAGEDMFVIDMRKAEDYAENHIKGAVSVPFGAGIADVIKDIPTDKDVYIYCYSGQTAGQAAALLGFAGIDVRSVAYGMKLGLAKVEGVDEVLTPDVTEVTPIGNEVPEAVTTAIKDYFANADGINIIPSDKLKEMQSNGDDFALVSARKQEDYDAGHIEGAILMSYGKGMQSEFASLPTDKRIVVYCYSGQTAGQVVATLRLLGYDAVSLKGGMGTPKNAPMGWVNEGNPTVTE